MITRLRVVVALAILWFLTVAGTLAGFMIWGRDVVPASTTYWGFWISNITPVLTTLYLVVWTIITFHSIEEQRTQRQIQFHPYLEIRPIKTVDQVGNMLPGADQVPEDYSRLVTPSAKTSSNDLGLNYLCLAISNQGQGLIISLRLEIEIGVPGTAFTRTFTYEDEPRLAHNQTRLLTILPFTQLPRYEVRLKRVEYSDPFGKYKHFIGPSVIQDEHPQEIAEKNMQLVFVDDFKDQPNGKGWITDYWGGGQTPSNVYVDASKPDHHVLSLQGDRSRFANRSWNESGAFFDLPVLPNQVFEITCRVRSLPGTTAQFKLWCHDNNLARDPKNRITPTRTPAVDWETFSMLYMSDTGQLRIHLHLIPDLGTIEVDLVTVKHFPQQG